MNNNSIFNQESRSILRWVLFVLFILSLGLLIYINLATGRVVNRYTDRDFKIKQISRALLQVRASVALASPKCLHYLSSFPAESSFLDMCYNGLDSAYSQMALAIKYDGYNELKASIDFIYQEIETFSIQDKKSRNLRLRDLQKKFEDIYDLTGVLESKNQQVIGQNYSFLIKNLNEYSEKSTVIVIFVLILLIFWIYQINQQEKIDKKLIEANEVLSLQEAKLIQAGKLSALGEMAAGVAHEINNPLAVIDGRIQLLRKQINRNEVDENKILDAIDKIDLMSKRINKIVKGMRNFSRDAENELNGHVSVKALIEESILLCENRFKNNGVEFIQEIEPSLQLVCSPTQVSQVLVNLLLNSFDAIVDLPIENKWIRLSVKKSNDSRFVEFSVEDSGTGIPEPLREKIFSPFFTTKEIGKGTGLGLSISKGIIEKHGGKIFIDKDSIHTKICFLLPIS